MNNTLSKWSKSRRSVNFDNKINGITHTKSAVIVLKMSESSRNCLLWVAIECESFTKFRQKQWTSCDVSPDTHARVLVSVCMFVTFQYEWLRKNTRAWREGIWKLYCPIALIEFSVKNKEMHLYDWMMRHIATPSNDNYIHHSVAYSMFSLVNFISKIACRLLFLWK